MTVYGYYIVEEGGMDEKGIYLYVFYYMCFIKDRGMDILEEILGVERNSEIEINNKERILNDR